MPGEDEVRRNPRARSAKLRAAPRGECLTRWPQPVRIRNQKRRSEQPDRPGGGRGAPARAVEDGRHGGADRVRVPLLGAAAHRAAPSRLRDSADAEGARRRGRARAPPPRPWRSRRSGAPDWIEALATGRLHLVAPSRDEAIVRSVLCRPTRRPSPWWHGGDREVSARREIRPAPVGRGVSQPPVDPRVELGRRVIAAACLPGLWAAGIELRLVYLQVVRHADCVARAERQQMRTIAVPGKRGDILDRRGRVLATSVDADSVYAVPTEINDPPSAAARLLLGIRRLLGKRLSRTGRQTDRPERVCLRPAADRARRRAEDCSAEPRRHRLS